MNTYKHIKLTTNEGVGILLIDRPDAMNALNSEVLSDISLAIKEVRASADIDVLIFTGSGKSFIAGADIAYMSGISTMEFREFTRYGQGVMNHIEALEIPTIAAINGFALGGGLELAMACDIRIASEKARFGQPEVGLGIIPGFGGTQRLPRLIGAGNAKHLIYSGEMIDANEAYRIGLVQKLLPSADFLDEVISYAQTINSKAPLAVRMSKSAINGGASGDVVSGVAFEAEASAVAFTTDDRVEGMQAFIEKRRPKFSKK